MSIYTRKLSKVQKGRPKARKDQVKYDHYNSIYMTIIGYSSGSLVLIGVNLQQKIIKTLKSQKGHTKAKKGQVKNDHYNSMLGDHNWIFILVFGIDRC